MQKILVTGATGYIGGRLVPLLLANNFQVRCLVRNIEKAQSFAWPDVELVEADVLDYDSLEAACQDIDVAYYLIHSMGDKKTANFNERDQKAAANFTKAAKKAKVKKIIYLSGLGDSSDDSLSAHLKSRHLTGTTLSSSGLPVIEFRAAQILGAGSISFEMMRYLVERLPVMIAPKWANTLTQPIAVDDVLSYLLAAATLDLASTQLPDTSIKNKIIIEIGAADVLPYKDLLKLYAKVRDLKRSLLIVPVLTPELSARWVHLITPIPANIARPLISGLRNQVIVQNQSAKQLFPDIQPLTIEQALHAATQQLITGDLPTIWSGAELQDNPNKATEINKKLADIETEYLQKKTAQKKGMFIESRRMLFNCSADRAFATFSCIGGEQGWFYGNGLWKIRGMWDRLLGGPGLVRGRRCNTNIRTGDALDFWRVEKVTLNKELVLKSEMKMPGRAWLSFRIQEQANIDSLNKSIYVEQTAWFEPHGLAGLIYWYSLVPAHYFLFSGMLRNIKQMAETK